MLYRFSEYTEKGIWQFLIHSISDIKDPLCLPIKLTSVGAKY